MQNLPPADPMTQVLNAHIQEHMAHTYIQQMSQMTGVPFAFPGPDAMDDDRAPPPEVETELAMMAAAAAEQLMAQQQQAQQQPTPDELKVMSEIERKDAIAQAEIERKNAIAQADIERKTGTLAAAEVRKNASMVNDNLRKMAEADLNAQLKVSQQKSQGKLDQLDKARTKETE
jgi:uncharacterized small protein (DUF1192 family)